MAAVCPDSLPVFLKRSSTDPDGEDVTREDCCPHLLTRAFFPQDGRVFIWTCDDASGNTWSPKLLHKFNDVVWHVSWSITANILAVSGGDNKVSSVTQSCPTPWTAACQASLFITDSQSALKLVSIESVMPSSHLVCVVFKPPTSSPAPRSPHFVLCLYEWTILGPPRSRIIKDLIL